MWGAGGVVGTLSGQNINHTYENTSFNLFSQRVVLLALGTVP